jgi:hypothetical protein
MSPGRRQGRERVGPRDERGSLWPGGAPGADTSPMNGNGQCPSCRQGDLITISMSVSERDLKFTTCHMCEAKWWYQHGQLVPLSSVIDLVVNG